VLQVPGFAQAVSPVKKVKPTLRAMARSNSGTPMHGRYITVLLNETAARAFNDMVVQKPTTHVSTASMPYGSVIVKVNFTTKQEPAVDVAPLEGLPWLTVRAKKMKGCCNPASGGFCIGGLHQRAAHAGDSRRAVDGRSALSAAWALAGGRPTTIPT
jgi:hypothetical protein